MPITNELIQQLTELAHTQSPEIRAWIGMHVANDILKRKEARGRKMGKVRAVAVRLKSNPHVTMYVPKDAIAEAVEIESL